MCFFFEALYYIHLIQLCTVCWWWCSRSTGALHTTSGLKTVGWMLAYDWLGNRWTFDRPPLTKSMWHPWQRVPHARHDMKHRTLLPVRDSRRNKFLSFFKYIINFCQVEDTKKLIHLKPLPTSLNQKWKGNKPSFIIIINFINTNVVKASHRTRSQLNHVDMAIRFFFMFYRMISRQSSLQLTNARPHQQHITTRLLSIITFNSISFSYFWKSRVRCNSLLL